MDKITREMFSTYEDFSGKKSADTEFRIEKKERIAQEKSKERALTQQELMRIPEDSDSDSSKIFESIIC